MNELERRGTRPVRTKGASEDLRRLARRIEQLEASVAWWKVVAARTTKIAKEWRETYRGLCK